MKLTLTQSIHQEIKTHLESTFPNEGGGFLIGRYEGDSRVVTEIRVVENVFDTEEQYHRYLMEDGAFQQAEDYADEQGLALVGYFHSHPDSPAIPSEYDRVHALPNFIYLILSVQEAKAVDSRVWVLADDRSHFETITLEKINGNY